MLSLFSDLEDRALLESSILENEVDEIIDTEDELTDNYAEIEREMNSADTFIDDELDEMITQADIDQVTNELRDEYEAELVEDDELENDYSKEDDLENPFVEKSTVTDYLNDF
jgi:benzoyl-CoA reductase/2-hydroxyglutaryl-CoA dehydratase subunit BcrC/BadD/HgdB